MSKTFKSDNELAKTISITRSQGRVLVEIEDPKHLIAINLSDTTAPALALAILEAAGFEDSSSGGCITGARIAVGDLRRHVAKQERATAEAKEQAELEAEALEFLNVYRSISGCEPLKEWRQAGGVQEHYLAIARHARTRRAREMREEK